MQSQKVVGFVLGFAGLSQYPEMQTAPYPRWARCAARRFREATGFECRVIGEAELGRRPADHYDLMRTRMFWPRLLPDADVAVNVDADLMFLRGWDPRPYCADGALVAVRTRSWWNRTVAEHFAARGIDPNWVVGGLWAAPRSAAPVFEECADRWGELSQLANHDVGALSRVLEDRKHPIRFVDQRAQWLHWDRLGPRVGVIAMHEGWAVYRHWDAGTLPAVTDDLPWDLDAMRERADGFLREDGTAADGKGWFISRGHLYRHDPASDALCP